MDFFVPTFAFELPDDFVSLSSATRWTLPQQRVTRTPTSAGCIAVSDVREIVFVRCQRRYTVFRTDLVSGLPDVR
jgi:hypothetical protein